MRTKTDIFVQIPFIISSIILFILFYVQSLTVFKAGIRALVSCSRSNQVSCHEDTGQLKICLALISQGIEMRILKKRCPVGLVENKDCVEFLYTLQKKIRPEPLNKDGQGRHKRLKALIPASLRNHREWHVF
jgi:hypothetical protein